MALKTYDCTGGGAQYCQGCYTMEEVPDDPNGTRYGDWVRLEDYERLEKLLFDAKRMAEFGDINEDMDDDGIGWKQWYLDVKAILPISNSKSVQST